MALACWSVEYPSMNEPDVTDAEDPSATEPVRPTQLADADALDRFLDEADVALVEFYTEGCGICRSMEPVLGNVARELSLPTGLVNPRDDPPLVDRFDVRSVPLLLLFVDGDPVARREDGFVSGDDLTAWIGDELPERR
jgi:thiol-disulfide isomerase/thioredoxin